MKALLQVRILTQNSRCAFCPASEKSREFIFLKPEQHLLPGISDRAPQTNPTFLPRIFTPNFDLTANGKKNAFIH
jgi:hypothetical protein